MPQSQRAAKPQPAAARPADCPGNAGAGPSAGIAIEIEIVIPDLPFQAPLLEAILEPTPGTHVDDHATLVLHAMKQIVLAFGTARIDICFIHQTFPRTDPDSRAVPVTGGHKGGHARTLRRNEALVKKFKLI